MAIRNMHGRIVGLLVFVIWLSLIGFAPQASAMLQTGPSLVEHYQQIICWEANGKACENPLPVSRYDTPIAVGTDGLSGCSRRSGDASPEVQAVIIDRIIRYCREHGHSEDDAAFLLAVAWVESGFNPDAASCFSSAACIFQFTQATYKTLCERAGVSPQDPFCVDTQFAILGEHLKEVFPFASRQSDVRGSDEFYELAYAYHHDGPSLAYGGQGIARKRVLPKMKEIRKHLN